MANQIDNIASERAVIAGLIKHGSESFIDVDDIIDVNAFTLEENQILYACLVKIFENNNEVDFPSILSAAKDIGLDTAFENRIPPERIRALINLDIAIGNVRHHAVKLKKLNEQLSVLYPTLETSPEMRPLIRSLTLEKNHSLICPLR